MITWPILLISLVTRKQIRFENRSYFRMQVIKNYYQINLFLGYRKFMFSRISSVARHLSYPKVVIARLWPDKEPAPSTCGRHLVRSSTRNRPSLSWKDFVYTRGTRNDWGKGLGECLFRVLKTVFQWNCWRRSKRDLRMFRKGVWEKRVLHGFLDTLI